MLTIEVKCLLLRFRISDMLWTRFSVRGFIVSDWPMGCETTDNLLVYLNVELVSLSFTRSSRQWGHHVYQNMCVWVCTYVSQYIKSRIYTFSFGVFLRYFKTIFLVVNVRRIKMKNFFDRNTNPLRQLFGSRFDRKSTNIWSSQSPPQVFWTILGSKRYQRYTGTRSVNWNDFKSYH